MRINCQLKGSTFCEGQCILTVIKAQGQPIQLENLLLVRDYNCPQDKNCVQVNYRLGSQYHKLGNVNRENAPRIAACMDSGGTATIASATLYGNIDEGQNVGMFFWVNTVDNCD